MLYYPLLALMFPFMQADTTQVDSTRTDNTIRVDTLKELEVRGDSTLRVNDAIRQTIGRELQYRQGTPTVSDVIGGKATDMIMHPFAIKDRKRDRKHARDRKILEEYEQLGRVKTFEELLDEAIRQQAIEDGKEPPSRSGKKE
ncbi:MAG: hypothetical protein IJ615_07745 [Bacteroidaceae bacterium]|nr:hypothetical protein [Bacteroidaceae bacterium]